MFACVFFYVHILSVKFSVQKDSASQVVTSKTS